MRDCCNWEWKPEKKKNARKHILVSISPKRNSKNIAFFSHFPHVVGWMMEQIMLPRNSSSFQIGVLMGRFTPTGHLAPFYPTLKIQSKTNILGAKRKLSLPQTNWLSKCRFFYRKTPEMIERKSILRIPRRISPIGTSVHITRRQI